MLTKMLKPLTLSFLLTALCVGIAVWTTSTGLAVNNLKCGGSVVVTSQNSCGRSSTESTCSGTKAHTNRSSNKSCNISEQGYNCEETTRGYESHVFNCKWQDGNCTSKSGNPTYSGSGLAACNVTPPKS